MVERHLPLGRTERFETPYGLDRQSKLFTIRDRQTVRLFGPEISIVDSPAFQRLHGIKQLGTAYLVFRSATHTRFEHSLGTLDAVQRIIDAVNRNPKAQRRVCSTGVRLARLAALLHDLTHVPFGHTLEDELGLMTRHDRNDERLHELLIGSDIGDLLREELASRMYGGTTEYDLLLRVLTSACDDDISALGDLAYVADLVANTVCADALDYIPRDLDGCGMPTIIGDRFLEFFVITGRDQPNEADANRMALRLDKRGMPRLDVETEVIKLLEARYQLVERVFFHHAKNAASVMLGRAVQEMGLHEHDVNFRWLSDDALLLALAVPAVADALKLAATDDPDRRAQAAALAGAIMLRRTYKLAFLGVADDDVTQKAASIYATWGRDTSERLRLEAHLAQSVGLEDGDVLVHVPDPTMLTKPAKVRVLLDDGTVSDLERWDATHTGRVEALRRAHARLWRVAVYVHPRALGMDGTVDLLVAAAKSAFGLRTRYARHPELDPYFAALFDRHAADRGWALDLRSEAVELAPQIAADAERAGGHASHELATNLVRLELAVEHIRSDRERDR